LDINNVTQNQLSAIPGLGVKGAWKVISKRAIKLSKNNEKITSVSEAFTSAGVNMPELADRILVVK